MKTILFIISIAAVFLITEQPGTDQSNNKKTAYSAASIDSILESGRVEMLRNKMQ